MGHGWADALVPSQLTVDFYETLAQKSGGMAATQGFAHLFMVPLGWIIAETRPMDQASQVPVSTRGERLSPTND
jgi:hypothetical protein